MAKDALDAHARDELGFSEGAQPKPIQAAFASARRVLARRRVADAGGVSRAARRRR